MHKLFIFRFNLRCQCPVVEEIIPDHIQEHAHSWWTSPEGINLPLFSTVVTSNICMFLSCRPVNCPSQETEVTSTPTRPVDNVVIATKGLQDKNINIIAGTTVENKGKLILTEIFPSVQKHDIFQYSCSLVIITILCFF